jgi:transposase InsO family protein
MKTKDEAFDCYKKFSAWVKTHHNVVIKVLRSDRGGEYLGDEFSQFLSDHGTTRRLTVHDTPEYNGVAERLN